MASKEKKPAGFFLYPEHVRAACAMLSPADAGRLLLALCDYAETGALPANPRKAFQACFSLLQGDVDRDAERYREICERNRELANRRWHGDPPLSHAPASPGMPPHAYTTQPNTTQPSTTHPSTTHPSTTHPHAGAAAAASGAYPRSTMKGDHHDLSGNLRKAASARGTVL